MDTVDTRPRIYFYSSRKPYFEFTNFSRHPITIDGVVWPTTEHYFQAAKFNDAELKETVRLAKAPAIAAKMGRDRAYTSKMRSDWDKYRLEAMMDALRAKFTQHKELTQLLLDTGDAELFEDSPKDYFWGAGADRTGNNQLGILLMDLRSELREKEENGEN